MTKGSWIESFGKNDKPFSTWAVFFTFFFHRYPSWNCCWAFKDKSLQKYHFFYGKEENKMNEMDELLFFLRASRVERNKKHFPLSQLLNKLQFIIFFSSFLRDEHWQWNDTQPKRHLTLSLGNLKSKIIFFHLNLDF